MHATMWRLLKLFMEINVRREVAASFTWKKFVQVLWVFLSSRRDLWIAECSRHQLPTSLKWKLEFGGFSRLTIYRLRLSFCIQIVWNQSVQLEKIPRTEILISYFENHNYKYSLFFTIFIYIDPFCSKSTSYKLYTYKFNYEEWRMTFTFINKKKIIRKQIIYFFQ